MCQNNDEQHVEVHESKSARWAFHFSFIPVLGIPLFIVMSILFVFEISKSKESILGIGKLYKGIFICALNILFTSFLFLYQSDWFNERYYPNFQRKFVGSYDRNGEKTGLWIWWYEDGTKIEEIEFEKGVKKKSVIYDSDGNKKYGKTIISQDSVTEIEWYKNGQIKSKTTYKNGQRHGVYFEWYKNGVKKVEIGFNNGQEHGPHLLFWENGQKQYESGFINGKRRDGVNRGWHKNGQKSFESKSKNGFALGKWLQWDENGNLVLVKFFDTEGNGILKKIIYYENNKPAKEEIYDKDMNIIETNELKPIEEIDQETISEDATE